MRLRRPDLQNWGYDIVIFGSAATNPALLETLRPDELVAFISELHTFPTGPIRVVYDLVYGHADNQAIDLLNGRFLKGPNMYGQDVNHQNPVVRQSCWRCSAARSTPAPMASASTVARISSTSTDHRPGRLRRP